MILAVDFDGTIVEQRYPAIGPLMPNAVESINRLYDDGHYIIIWTSRDGAPLLEAINFLLHEGVKFHRVNDGNADNIAQYGSNSRKVYAHRYIDDRNIGGFPGWQHVYSEITREEKEWNEKNNKPQTQQTENSNILSLNKGDIITYKCLKYNKVYAAKINKSVIIKSPFMGNQSLDFSWVIPIDGDFFYDRCMLALNEDIGQLHKMPENHPRYQEFINH